VVKKHPTRAAALRLYRPDECAQKRPVDLLCQNIPIDCLAMETLERVLGGINLRRLDFNLLEAAAAPR
jgi:hypothetical protein